MPTVGAHVLASPMKSKDVNAVKKELFDFANEVLRMPYADSVQ